jgi:hypothetical protein
MAKTINKRGTRQEMAARPHNDEEDVAGRSKSELMQQPDTLPGDQFSEGAEPEGATAPNTIERERSAGTAAHAAQMTKPEAEGDDASEAEGEPEGE